MAKQPFGFDPDSNFLDSMGMVRPRTGPAGVTRNSGVGGAGQSPDSNIVKPPPSPSIPQAPPGRPPVQTGGVRGPRGEGGVMPAPAAPAPAPQPAPQAPQPQAPMPAPAAPQTKFVTGYDYSHWGPVQPGSRPPAKADWDVMPQEMRERLGVPDWATYSARERDWGQRSQPGGDIYTQNERIGEAMMQARPQSEQDVHNVLVNLGFDPNSREDMNIFKRMAGQFRGDVDPSGRFHFDARGNPVDVSTSDMTKRGTGADFTGQRMSGLQNVLAGLPGVREAELFQAWNSGKQTGLVQTQNGLWYAPWTGTHYDQNGYRTDAAGNKIGGHYIHTSDAGRSGQPQPAAAAPGQPQQPPMADPGQQGQSPAVAPYQPQVINLGRIPGRSEMNSFAGGTQVQTPYGTVSQDPATGQSTLSFTPEGKLAYATEVVRMRNQFVGHPFAGDPAAPQPPVTPGRPAYNAFLGTWVS